MAAFKPGDTVFESEPWVFSILSSKIQGYCYGCLQNPDQTTLRRCGGCHYARYCSQNCQKIDWNMRHKPECKVIHRALSDVDGTVHGQLFNEHADRFLILLKIIIKLKNNDITEPKGCRPRSPRSFEDLMSHEEEYLTSPRSYLVSAYNYLWPYLGLLDVDRSICPDFIHFIRLLGKFNINNFAIYAMEQTAITAVGRGLYLGPSVLDHSCCPNALQCDVGKTLVIKAVRPIDKFEDTRIAYILPFDTKESRLNILEERYFFTCMCPACTDTKMESERNSWKCTNTCCIKAIPMLSGDNNEPANDSIICPECGSDNSLQIHAAKQALTDLQNMVSALRQPPDEEPRIILENLQSCILTAEKFLHPTNFMLGLTYKEVAHWLSGLKDFDSPLLTIDYMRKMLVPRREHVKDYCFSVFCLTAKSLAVGGTEEETMEFLLDIQSQLQLVPGIKSLVYKSWCAFAQTL